MAAETFPRKDVRGGLPWAWLFILCVVLGCASLLFSVLGCFRLGPDAGAARDAAVAAEVSRDAWDRQVELNLGGLPLVVARVVTTFIDVPPEARACLRAARGLEVGVYRRLEAARPGAVYPEIMDETTATLRDRGWLRTVAVQDEQNTVCVFVREAAAADVFSVCVLVLDGYNLVVASGRVDAAPLIPMLAEKLRGQFPRTDRGRSHVSSL